MSVILILIFASLAMALIFLGAFVWATRSGQYDDTCTPSMRILGDDSETRRGRSDAPCQQNFSNSNQPKTKQ